MKLTISTLGNIMNKITSSIIAAAFAISTFSVYAATTPENADDASNLGTSDTPQKQQQDIRTDKGATEMSTGAIDDDASNLGTAETPQVQKQNMRTDKGASENTTHRPHAKKSKLMKTKEKNAGTTKGNKVQPNQPESAAPATQ